MLPLHGELPPAEQNRAVRPADRRKVILSTNVAETSVTIDGVVAVIDSGLARLAAHSPWSGLPTLQTGKISQAAAIQRAGRAGRTRPGWTLRLYTRHDFEGRRAYELPEVARLDLAEPLLALHALGVRDPAAWRWFEPPPAHALAAGEELLRRLGAVDAGGSLTDTGRALLRFPVHPRLARLMVEGERRGVGEEAAALAALIAERDIRERGRVQFRGGPGGPGAMPRHSKTPICWRGWTPSSRPDALASTGRPCADWTWTAGRWRRWNGCAGSWRSRCATRPTPATFGRTRWIRRWRWPRWPPSPTGSCDGGPGMAGRRCWRQEARPASGRIRRASCWWRWTPRKTRDRRAGGHPSAGAGRWCGWRRPSSPSGCWTSRPTA